MATATKIFEGLGPSTLIPQRGKVSESELSSLGPEEGFVLSRVDGHTTLEEICLLVPFEPQVTQVILRKLAEVGAIEVPGVPRKLMPRASGQMPAVGKPEPVAILPASDKAKPNPIREESGLSHLQQVRIDEIFANLDQRDAFTMLEIDPSADGKAVKRAYFKLSKEFHPDRFFGREIGDYRDKLSKIFQALKASFELLSDPNRRKAYEESAGLKKEK